MRREFRWTLLACIVLAALGTALRAQDEEAPAEEDLAAKSLPLRTALHQDPTLGVPLERLVDMYRKAGRVGELVGMYRVHLGQYPADEKARIVFVRMLLAVGDPGAPAALRTAIAQHENNPYLRFLRFQQLQAENEPTALDELDKAIELETLPARRRAWIDTLVAEAVVADRLPLAEKHLKGLAALEGATNEGRLDVARKMVHYKFYAPALELLSQAPAAGVSPETMVEMELVAAEAERGLGRSEAAAKRLDALLAKLTADHWRREEILRRRIALVTTEEGRQAMLGKARARYEARPGDEAAALELAQLLVGFEQRREALDVLLAAGEKLPASERIEKQTLELFDRLRDERGREKFLAERLKLQPNRADLALKRVQSLYFLARRKEAAEAFDALVKELPPEDRVKQLLSMARFLRRNGLDRPAAEVFARAVKLVPARLDIRRELAETYLALGQREQMRELFGPEFVRGGGALQADTENLLDLLQFMTAQELYVEAQALLEARLQDDRVNLDLRLALLKVHERLGNQQSGTALIARCRALADTPARYRRWLEGAAAFHEAFETREAFLDEEQARLDEQFPEWNADRLARWKLLAEAASRGEGKLRVAESIQNYLAGDLPDEVRVELSRQLAGILEKDQTQSIAAASHLEQLAKDDPLRADEYLARLAVLYAVTQRPDLGQQLLKRIDVTKLDDPVLLGSLRRHYGDYLGGRVVLEILKRRAELQPESRTAWRDWLAALAASGDERRLRGALRRLLLGVDQMPLSEETRDLLRKHAVDSYWRSASRLLSSGKPADLADLLALLDSVERTSARHEGWQWVKWSRALALNRLGRTKERDEAIAELEQALAQAALEPDDAADEGNTDEDEADEGAKKARADRIVFPDGLSVSLAYARELLTSRPAERAPEVVADRRGPLPPLDVAWAFDADAGTSITRVVPLKTARVLVFDSAGQVFCLDKATGKLLWQREALGTSPPDVGGAASAAMAMQAQSAAQWMSSSPFPQPIYYGSPYQQAAAPANPVRQSEPLVDDEGRLFVAAGGEVSCLSADDGSLRWRSELERAAGAPATLLSYGDKLLACSPAGGTVSCFDPATGKLLWYRDLDAKADPRLAWHNCGVSLAGRRLLMYGGVSAILDAENGEVIWRFESSDVRPFPVKLRGPADPDAAATAVASAAYPPNPYGGLGGYGPYGPVYQGIGGFPSGLMAARIQQQRLWQSTYGGGFGSGFFGGAQQGVTLVDHTQRSDGGNITIPAAGLNVALVAPAVAWAGDLETLRLGEIDGDRLLLLRDGQLSVSALNLPLGARRYDVEGTWLGTAGGVGCLLSSGALQTIDLANGRIRRCAFRDLMAGDPNARVYAALDGNTLYISGPAGIEGINVRTCRRIFQVSWPAEIAPLLPERPAGTAVDENGDEWQVVTVHYTCRGVVRQDSGALVEVRDAVEPGVLYARVHPQRVVALRGLPMAAGAEGGADGR